MVQMQTYLNVADNSGAKRVQCVKVLGGSKRKSASIGDLVVVAVKVALPNAAIRKGDVRRAVIVRTNKEYSALLVEANTLKDDKSRMETEALEQLAQVDELAAKLQAVTTNVAEQEKLVTFSRDEIVDANAEVADSLAQVKAEREEAVKEVPVDVMRLYDRMADAYEGEALAEILEESRRHLEYSCGGCYTIIPYERVNAVISSIDEITSCPSCNRILHIGQDLRASLVK